MNLEGQTRGQITNGFISDAWGLAFCPGAVGNHERGHDRFVLWKDHPGCLVANVREGTKLETKGQLGGRWCQADPDSSSKGESWTR